MLASISSFISDPNSYKGRKRTLSSVFSVHSPRMRFRVQVPPSLLNPLTNLPLFSTVWQKKKLIKKQNYHNSYILKKAQKSIQLDYEQFFEIVAKLIAALITGSTDSIVTERIALGFLLSTRTPACTVSSSFDLITKWIILNPVQLYNYEINRVAKKAYTCPRMP